VDEIRVVGDKSKFDSKWCSKYPVKTQPNFFCVFFSREFSCTHQGGWPHLSATVMSKLFSTIKFVMKTPFLEVLKDRFV
jgi:hypothetical protein